MIITLSLSEPNATEVQKQGLGHIVAYLGELGGDVPYTAYNARKSYIEKNPKIISSFTKAINKALEYTEKNDAETIANHIIDYFPDTALNNLIEIIKNYKKGEAWKKNINITEDEWKHIQEIIIEADQLDSYVPYKDLIYTKYFIENE